MNFIYSNMEIRELSGKEIMNAYDGNYLSSNFGYSCANFNVDYKPYSDRPEIVNDEALYDFYVFNPNNISCFVYIDKGKIKGRRMFFKGSSMIDDKRFGYPIKLGEEVKYLYGYYGEESNSIYHGITKEVMNKYEGIIFTDRNAFENGNRKDYPNNWIMRVERSDFSKYPPVDYLKISTELRALSNFTPMGSILSSLEDKFKINNIGFRDAYRYTPRIRRKIFEYMSWLNHKDKN